MNIRRTIATAAAAGALILTPVAAAVAAPGDGDYTGSAPESAVVGQSFPVTISGAQPGEDVTLTITYDDPITDADITIAGTKSHTKAANAAGVATFSVTIAAAGTVELKAVGAESGVLFTDTVQVGTAVPTGDGQGGKGTPTPADKGGDPDRLSDAGAPTALYAGGAAVLMLGAGGALYAAKRRAGQSA